MELTGHQRAMLGHALNDGYFAWAGLTLIAHGEGFARVAFRPRPEMTTPWATINGGVINGLVEMPSFVALLPTLGDGEKAVTNDIFVQHLRPMPAEADYVLEGRLLRRGRGMAWTDVTVLTGGKETSLARITKTILPAA